jgi:hypothetical protein
MSHCAACDCLLTDLEATRKTIHGDFVELCNSCLFPIRKDIPLANNFDLNIIEKEVDDE